MNYRRPLTNDNVTLLPVPTNLEEGRSQIILNENATNAPDITGMTPAQI